MNADSNGSRQVSIDNNSTVSLLTDEFRSPLAQLDSQRAYPVSATTKGKSHRLDPGLKKEMLLIIDDVGIRMKDSEGLQVVCKPAANHFVISELFKTERVNIGMAHIAIHVGTNSVQDFRRHRVITEVLQLIEGIRQKTSAWIYLSSLVPRPIDHEDTAFKVRDFNHAVKKAVAVATNSGKTGIIYVSNQQLYLKENGLINNAFFHKKQLALSKAGIQCLKNNLFAKANLTV